MVIYFGRIRFFTFAKIEDEDIYHSYEKFYNLYTRFPTLYSLKMSLIFNIDLCKNLLYFLYICKTWINVQPLIDVQSSNPCPNSTSQTSVPQIYVLFQILKSVAVSHFFKSTSNDVTDVCPNRNQ